MAHFFKKIPGFLQLRHLFCLRGFFFLLELSGTSGSASWRILGLCLLLLPEITNSSYG